MGMLYLRGRIWWIKYYRNGKAFRESSRSKNISGAKRLLRKREGEICSGEFVGLKSEQVTFEELAEDLLNEYQINKRKSFTWVKRRVDLHLRPFFASLRAVNITTDRVRAYVAERQQEGASNGSINRELAALKRMFSLASIMTPPKIARAP